MKECVAAFTKQTGLAVEARPVPSPSGSTKPSMVLFVVSTMLGGVNYITTIIDLRTRGMCLTKLPLPI